MEKKIIKEVIVVEGKDDTNAILRAVKADTIETRGSALSMETIKKIQMAQELRGVIVLTDPDYPGEKIRKTISQYVPDVKHAFINRDKARKKNNIGVENASPQTIIMALEDAKIGWINEPEELITWDEIIDAGLVAGDKARERRMKLGEILGIGYNNAKQLYKRLRMFQISYNDFIRAIEEIDKKE